MSNDIEIRMLQLIFDYVNSLVYIAYHRQTRDIVWWAENIVI